MQRIYGYRRLGLFSLLLRIDRLILHGKGGIHKTSHFDTIHRINENCILLVKLTSPSTKKSLQHLISKCSFGDMIITNNVSP